MKPLIKIIIMLSLEMKTAMEKLKNNCNQFENLNTLGQQLSEQMEEITLPFAKLSELFKNIEINTPHLPKISLETGCISKIPEAFYSSEFAMDDEVWNMKFITKV